MTVLDYSVKTKELKQLLRDGEITQAEYEVAMQLLKIVAV